MMHEPPKTSEEWVQGVLLIAAPTPSKAAPGAPARLLSDCPGPRLQGRPGARRLEEATRRGGRWRCRAPSVATLLWARGASPRGGEEGELLCTLQITAASHYH